MLLHWRAELSCERWEVMPRFTAGSGCIPFPYYSTGFNKRRYHFSLRDSIFFFFLWHEKPLFRDYHTEWSGDAI